MAKKKKQSAAPPYMIRFYMVVLLVALLGVTFFVINNFINQSKVTRKENTGINYQSLYATPEAAEAELDRIAQALGALPLDNYPPNGQFEIMFPALITLADYLNAAPETDEKIAHLKIKYGDILDGKREDCYLNFNAEQINVAHVSEYQLDLLSNNLICNALKEDGFGLDDCITRFAHLANDNFNVAQICQQIVNDTMVYNDLLRNNGCSAQTLASCLTIDPECAEFCEAFPINDTTMCQNEETAGDLAECLTILTGSDAPCNQLDNVDEREACVNTFAIMQAFKAGSITACNTLPRHDAHYMMCNYFNATDFQSFDCEDDNYERFRRRYCGHTL